MNLTLTTKTAGHPRLLLLISSFCCADNVFFSLFHLPLVEPAYFYNILQASHTRNQLIFFNTIVIGVSGITLNRLKLSITVVDVNLNY